MLNLKVESTGEGTGNESPIGTGCLYLTLVPANGFVLSTGLHSWISIHFFTLHARTTLPNWDEAADAWFLDGFSPAKNPELWEEDLLINVGRHTKPGGTVATYTAAGFVRRGLEAAGFAVERRAGFGRKRHMTIGQLA